MRREAESSST